MTGKLKVNDIDIILTNLLDYLQHEFDKQLIAVVIYGSYAQGKADHGSDVDLLIVIKELLRDWQIIHQMEDDCMFRAREFGKRFQITLASPEDVEDSIESAAPLMLEIYNKHSIIFDPSGFFRDCIDCMEHIVKERGIRMKRHGVWEVPEHAVSL
jgi:predicted nucleotidyltransferase